ncbi:MAG TPA: hypothetical protein VMO88_17345, partial [Acidimicrobiales bacterium]|nr:hypothetical protein [Acidimicrobiales bacterium]
TGRSRCTLGDHPNGQHMSGMSTAKLSRVVSRPVVRIPELHYRPAGYVRTSAPGVPGAVVP